MTSASSFSSHNRGPLTTTFTPPASCLSTTTSSANSGTDTALWIGHFNTEGDTACYPRATTSITTPVNGYYYSPGFCPSGYSSACDLTTLLGIGTILPGTTGAACCPTGYQCVDRINCGSAVLDNGTISNAYILTNAPWSSIGFPSSISVGPAAVTSGQIVVAEIIPVLWQSTDQAVLVAMGLEASPSSSNADSGSSLSTGARVGIGIGVAVAVLGMLLGGFIFFRRYRQRRRRVDVQELPPPIEPAPAYNYEPVIELQGDSDHPYFGKNHPGYKDPYIMSPIPPVEVEAASVRSELPAEIPPSPSSISHVQRKPVPSSLSPGSPNQNSFRTVSPLSSPSSQSGHTEASDRYHR